MSDLHLDSSFYKQSMDIDKYFKIKKWHDSSIGQSTVIQQLDKKRPKLSNLNQMQNRRRYVNVENGSHFICSFNLNNPELTVCIVFRMNNIASGDYPFLNTGKNQSVPYYVKIWNSCGIYVELKKFHYISIVWKKTVPQKFHITVLGQCGITVELLFC